MSEIPEDREQSMEARLVISRETDTHWTSGALKQDRPDIDDDKMIEVPGHRLKELLDNEMAMRLRRHWEIGMAMEMRNGTL